MWVILIDWGHEFPLALIWPALYPRPFHVTFENGFEFKSAFKEIRDNLGIKFKPTTYYNPQGNSRIKRIHWDMGNILRSFEPEERQVDPDDPVNELLQACVFGIIHYTG
jgi:hypothetical protein